MKKEKIERKKERKKENLVRKKERRKEKIERKKERKKERRYHYLDCLSTLSKHLGDARAVHRCTDCKATETGSISCSQGL